MRQETKYDLKWISVGYTACLVTYLDFRFNVNLSNNAISGSTTEAFTPVPRL